MYHEEIKKQFLATIVNELSRKKAERLFELSGDELEAKEETDLGEMKEESIYQYLSQGEALFPSSVRVSTRLFSLYRFWYHDHVLGGKGDAPKKLSAKGIDHSIAIRSHIIANPDKLAALISEGDCENGDLVPPMLWLLWHQVRPCDLRLIKNEDVKFSVEGGKEIVSVHVDGVDGSEYTRTITDKRAIRCFQKYINCKSAERYGPKGAIWDLTPDDCGYFLKKMLTINSVQRGQLITDHVLRMRYAAYTSDKTKATPINIYTSGGLWITFRKEKGGKILEDSDYREVFQCDSIPKLLEYKKLYQSYKEIFHNPMRTD